MKKGAVSLPPEVPDVVCVLVLLAAGLASSPANAAATYLGKLFRDVDRDMCFEYEKRNQLER